MGPDARDAGPGRPAGEGASTDALARVRRLAAELAARVRYAQMVGRPIAPGQVTALVAAVRLLQEHGETPPLLLAQVLRRVADDLDLRTDAEAGPADEPR